jgi:hypothetical protein
MTLKSQRSNVVACFSLQIVEPLPIAEVTFELTPLLGGFAARLTPDSRGWATSYGASSLWLKFTPQSALNEVSEVKLYEFNPRQNFSVQRTVLGLRLKAWFQVWFQLRDAENVVLVESQPATIKTLGRDAPTSPPPNVPSA